MARPNFTITRTLTCPNVVVTDTTVYPADPDPHKLANYNLYLVKVYDEINQGYLTDYSSIVDLADELLSYDTTYNFELLDGLFKITFYVVPTGVVGLAYLVNDCILVAGFLYICTNAGNLDNVNPTLSVDSLWTLLEDETSLYSDYIEEFYVVSICNYAIIYRDRLQTSLITNSSFCPKIGNDQDFVDCMKIIELFNYGSLVNPSSVYLSSATARTKVIEAFSKLSLICQ